MAHNGQQFDTGGRPRRAPLPPGMGGGDVQVEAWQQRKRPLRENEPRGQAPVPVRRMKRTTHTAPAAHRGGHSRNHSYSHSRARQVWNSGRGRRRRRKRRGGGPMLPILLGLCLILAIVLIIKLITGGGGGKPPAETDYADITNVAVTPYNGEIFVLALDAGHGGDDPGALNPSETIYESTVTREMLNRVYTLFDTRQPDAVQLVVTTEEGQTLHSRAERAAVANSAGADLFLSLHLNSDAKTSVNGFQAYAQPPTMATNGRSVQFAEILAGQVGEKTGLKLIGGSGVYYMFYADKYTAYPYEYTSAVAGAHQDLDTYGVLQHANCPAVLIEQWYITNSSDMGTMYTEEGMNAMAECIYTAVCMYFGLEA